MWSNFSHDAHFRDGEHAHAATFGADIFSGFNYEIDNAAHSIRFTKKSTGGGGGNFGSGDTVPYERDPNNPNHLIVVAQVNGKSMKMFFDTGAQGVVMTRAQARAWE